MFRYYIIENIIIVNIINFLKFIISCLDPAGNSFYLLTM